MSYPVEYDWDVGIALNILDDGGKIDGRIFCSQLVNIVNGNFIVSRISTSVLGEEYFVIGDTRPYKVANAWAENNPNKKDEQRIIATGFSYYIRQNKNDLGWEIYKVQSGGIIYNK